MPGRGYGDGSNREMLEIFQGVQGMRDHNVREGDSKSISSLDDEILKVPSRNPLGALLRLIKK